VTKAFVFINVNSGSETEVANKLREVPEVKETYLVYGVYDVVLKIEADSVEHLKEVLSWKVRKLNNIRSTLTTIISEER
jgi:DNA-binding Lrp family transcriptional regulator